MTTYTVISTTLYYHKRRGPTLTFTTFAKTTLYTTSPSLTPTTIKLYYNATTTILLTPKQQTRALTTYTNKYILKILYIPTPNATLPLLLDTKLNFTTPTFFPGR